MREKLEDKVEELQEKIREASVIAAELFLELTKDRIYYERNFDNSYLDGLDTIPSKLKEIIKLL